MNILGEIEVTGANLGSADFGFLLVIENQGKIRVSCQISIWERATMCSWCTFLILLVPPKCSTLCDTVFAHRMKRKSCKLSFRFCTPPWKRHFGIFSYVILLGTKHAFQLLETLLEQEDQLIDFRLHMLVLFSNPLLVKKITWYYPIEDISFVRIINELRVTLSTHHS